MGRSDDDPVKPSDLSEAEREALKRQYRGVFWDRKTKRWRCQLGYQSKKIFLGYFDDAGEAARAYDQKLVELRGAGARTNFPITEYLDLMPTPTKRGGAGAAAVAAAAAAAANREGAGMDEDQEEDDGEEIDQPSRSGRNGAAAAAAYGAETPSLDPAYPSGAGGRLGGLLDGSAGVGGYAGRSSSPRHGLSHLPAIAPLSTDLPGDPHHAALAAQDYDMAGEEDLAAAAQLAIEIRRSFDGSNFKWQHQHPQYGGLPPQLATATSTGSAGGSAAAAAAAGYAGRGGDYDLQQRTQQQQSGGTYRDETAAAAAAGYGGNASLYGSYGHHHHAAAAHHHHQQQQHYAQHHTHLRNGSTPGDMYGSSQGWADPAAAAAAGGPFEGHPGYGAHSNSHYAHHSAHHHHSHSGLAGAHGGFSDSGGYAGYSMHHQQHSHHAAAAAAAAAGYGHHAHHAQHYQQQHARHYQHQLYHQQQQQGAGAGFYPGDGEDQHLAHAGHMQHGHQQQHFHAHHQHQHQQQAHGHFPLHHSHSYPGAVGHEGMDGTAAAGYYGHGAGGPTYSSHAQAVAAYRLSHAHSSGHLPAHHAALHQQQQQQQEHFAAAGPHSRSGGDLASAQGVYGSSGDLQQHYGGGLAAAQQAEQQYDARAAASNPAVTPADYRQRLATYGLHGYASDAGEYAGGAGMEAEGHRGYAGNHMQHYQQHHEHQQQQLQADTDLAGATAMDAAGPGGAGDPYGSQQQAAYQTEDPWIQSRGFGRGSAAGEDGGLADVAAAEGLPAVKATRASGRTSRATNRGAAAAAALDSDDYDAEDDDDYGSDSDTGRGRGRNSRRRSRAQAAAGGHSNGDTVLRTKQRTGDGGDDERGHSYRGVFWDKKSRRWRCQLGHKNKKIFLGYFGVAEDAARAYDQKLVELHGGAAKTNFPIQNYLGGGTVAGSKDNSAAAAAAVAESPRAPGGADVPGRRRSSHAGDASAKASQAQQSELSWGALGLPRSARLSHDASEGAPRLSWAGVDTLSSWDQQDPDSQYAKRRRLMEGGGQLPTSPQEYGALTGGLHSHQAVAGDDMLSPASMARQSSGYRVVETPSVQPGLAGRHSGTGQPAPAPSFDAAAMAAGILPSSQQLPTPIAASGRNSSLTLSRLASGEVGAVQALSGLHALGGRSNSGPAGLAQAAAAAGSGSLDRASSGVPVLTGSAAANAVLAAAGASTAVAAGGPGASGALPQQQQSQASRLFEEAVHQYGGRPSGVGLPARPSAVSAVAAVGRVSDPNTGASSSTATPPSALTAGGHFGGHGGTSPHDAAAAALSRLNSSEVRAVQALSGIHNDVLPYQSRAGMHAGGMHQQQQQGYMTPAVSAPPQPAPSPASITETVAHELLCRAPVVSAVASSSIAAVAAAAAAAAAAKGSAAEAATAAVVACNSADGSFSGLVGEMAAGLGGGRLRAMTPPNAVNTERLSTPGLSPLITGSMLLPPPPPLQLQFDGQDLGGDSLPGTASAAAAAAAAVGIANAGRALGASAGTGADPNAASAKVLSHIDPGDAFAAEAGWGGLDDLLMPKKRPSCSGNSGLIGLLENIGQFKNEADAAAEAVAVPQQQQQDAALEEQQQAQALQVETPAAGSAAAVGASTAEDASQQAAQQLLLLGSLQEASAQPAAPAAPLKAETAAATAGPAAAAALMPAAAATAALSGPGHGLPSGPVSFMTPTAEPMAVLP